MKIRTDIPITDSPSDTINKITNFWDKYSLDWCKLWGRHFHHGYFEAEISDPDVAQQHLLEKLVNLLQIPLYAKILDVGCGIGSSSIFLAKRYQAEVTGVTLSTKQVDIARLQAKQEQVAVTFKREDAHLLKTFSDNYFDIVWSLESCEQFYDKALFLRRAYQVLKPQGQLLLATWCSGREEYSGKMAQNYRSLCNILDLPYMPTVNQYIKVLQENGYKLEQVHDWSQHVKQSWDLGLARLHDYSWWQLFKLGGFEGLKILRGIKLMRQFFNEGYIQYGVFVAKK